MRGRFPEKIKEIREEVLPLVIESISYCAHEASAYDTENFYVDLREFMPTAPGPYAPGYKDRSAIGGYPYPTEEKTSDYNLAVDKAIRDYVVENFNLDTDLNNYENFQRTVQAIADKDADCNHLFGKPHSVDGYEFNPVFGPSDLGHDIYPSLATQLCAVITDVVRIGSRQRSILQGHSGQIQPPQYGRLRPGCSWEREAQRHSYKNDRENVLVDFDIEDNDGNPTGCYNQDGEWIDKRIKSPEEFNNVMKDELWANSYPSGHSSGIWNAALTLMELIPVKADKIMAAANRFAVNRTIARYHWNSDTIQGRVLASCINPVMHCCSDYEERLKKAKEELV